jgi:uncharacterized protein YbaR (Trm112 family)
MYKKTLDKIVCSYCRPKLTLNGFNGFPISAGIGNMLPEHFTELGPI